MALHNGSNIVWYQNDWRKNKCGPGQPPRPHSYVISCAASSPLGGGMTASARQHSRKECRICQSPAADSSSCDHEPATAAVSSGPFLLPASKKQKSEVGEEAATPGQPVALSRGIWRSAGDSPSRIAGCRCLCRNHSASTRTLTFR